MRKPEVATVVETETPGLFRVDFGPEVIGVIKTDDTFPLAIVGQVRDGTFDGSEVGTYIDIYSAAAAIEDAYVDGLNRALNAMIQDPESYGYERVAAGVGPDGTEYVEYRPRA
jgi:hypothetical protein